MKGGCTGCVRQRQSFNPFDEVPFDPSKLRTPSKSATRSRIGTLTVGDVRYIFTQLRGYSDINPNRTLWTGESAGSFSLNYLLQSNNMLSSTGEKKTKKSQGRLQ
ncbi:hypothetical protein JKP88DRAFT_161668 [Tribonema minus]|uniref:Uncharacterized protein n=1 Tax=Tribonema minus TaxID=303371 RepID=A0A835Z8A2_9STRA|nr:hypothetical protein JKP88DRAFT_161668 [Tribonema minus]